MFTEKNEIKLRKVLRGDLIGYTWWEDCNNFILINGPEAHSEEKKPRLFIFDNGSVPKETVDEIYKQKKFEVSISENPEYERDNYFHTFDKTTGIHSRWELIGSYDAGLTQRKNLYKIFRDMEKSHDRRPREIIPKKITRMENFLRNYYSKGFFDSRTYNSLIGHKNPENRFKTDIRVARSDGIYDTTALGNELNDLECAIEGATGLKPDEKVQFKKDKRGIVFGKLYYKQKIGEVDNIQVFTLTDEYFKKETEYIPEYNRMPNFNGDGKRLANANKNNIEHKALVTLYPDKFLASDGGRHPPMYGSGCSEKVLDTYKKEKKCSNWWSSHNR